MSHGLQGDETREHVLDALSGLAPPSSQTRMMNLCGIRLDHCTSEVQASTSAGRMMQVGFRTTQLAKLCSDPSVRRRKLGEERARKVQLRLDQLVAAADLSVLCALPQARCHQLTGDRFEQFSLDLDGPHRMLIEVADNPVPRTDDGGIARDLVRRVVVIEIVDPH